MSNVRLARVDYKNGNYVCKDCGRKTRLKDGELRGNHTFLHDVGCPSASLKEDNGVFHFVVRAGQ